MYRAGDSLLSATIIGLRTDGKVATAMTPDGFQRVYDVRAFIQVKRNEQAQADALRIGDVTNANS